MVQNILQYASLSLLIILINIPFGYWRGGTKKFSFLWFLFIHLPVPIVIYLRTAWGIELSWTTAPLLFGSYFSGQFLGKIIRRIKLAKEKSI